VADVRVHGTTHQHPWSVFRQEAETLVPTAIQASFLQAMVRERIVADDWWSRSTVTATPCLAADRQDGQIIPRRRPVADPLSR